MLAIILQFYSRHLWSHLCVRSCRSYYNEVILYGSSSVLSLIKEIPFHHIEGACGRPVNQKWFLSCFNIDDFMLTWNCNTRTKALKEISILSLTIIHYILLGHRKDSLGTEDRFKGRKQHQMTIVSKATDTLNLSASKAHDGISMHQNECKRWGKASRNQTASHSTLSRQSYRNATLADVFLRGSQANPSSQRVGIAVGLCRHLSPTTFNWEASGMVQASRLPERGG